MFMNGLKGAAITVIAACLFVLLGFILTHIVNFILTIVPAVYAPLVFALLLIAAIGFLIGIIVGDIF